MRRLFAKLSLAAILVLSALPHYAGAADGHAQRDSIERALPAMSAAERIAAYAELAEIAEPDEAIVWIDLMENLSRQTGDEAGIIAAMYKRAMYYYVAGTLEDFLDASGAVAPLLLEAGDRRYVFTEILVIKRLIAEGRTETASRAARKFLEVAGESDSRYMEGYANYGIGLTCQAGGYLEESATAMEKGYATLLSEKDVASTTGLFTFSRRIFRKPALADPLLLLEQLDYRPEGRKCGHSRYRRPDIAFGQQRHCCKA